jgi:hypothetical protein
MNCVVTDCLWAQRYQQAEWAFARTFSKPVAPGVPALVERIEEYSGFPGARAGVDNTARFYGLEKLET